MSDTSYFDAYMRGERSYSYRMSHINKWKPVGLDSIHISLIRHSMPNLVADDFIGVQPMTRPIGQIFTIRPGTYTLNSTVTIPPNTTIRGEGFCPTYMRNS